MNIAFCTSTNSTGHASRGTGSYAKNLLDELQKSDCSVFPFENSMQMIKNADLVHIPFFDPFFLTLKKYNVQKTIVTVHDLIPIQYSEHFDIGIRGNIKWLVQKMQLQKVDHIITDSQDSKVAIKKYISYNESSISVIPLAFEPYYKVPSSNDIHDNLQQLNITKPYFVYVGDVNWNKNILSIIEAFSKIHAKYPEVCLVFVGKAFIDMNVIESREIQKMVIKKGLFDNVYYPGYLPAHNVACLFAGSVASLSVSYAEGYGLPLINAMACGAVTIASNCSALAEIAGPSIQIDPMDIISLAEGMEKAIKLSNDNRNKISKEAINFARKRTWKDVCNDTLKVYEKVYSRD